MVEILNRCYAGEAQIAESNYVPGSVGATSSEDMIFTYFPQNHISSELINIIDFGIIKTNPTHSYL